MLLLSKMMSLNCSKKSTLKIHVKLNKLLNVLAKECKKFKKSETVVSIRTSIPKISECYPFLIIFQVMFKERYDFLHYSEIVNMCI